MGDARLPPIAGWRERVDLPAWGLRGVRAKLDTGARTSAIDVATIEHLDDGRIRFEVVGRHKPKADHEVGRGDARAHERGQAEPRREAGAVVCVTPIRIGAIETEIELSLVCRKNMLCRMLLGRTALESGTCSSIRARSTDCSPSVARRLHRAALRREGGRPLTKGTDR
jgi:hypothetical protein